MRDLLVPFLIGTIMGLVGCQSVQDPCRSQCELASGGCTEQPIESFTDFETTKDAWEAELDVIPGADFDGDGVQDIPFIYAGECENSTLFLYRGTGFSVLVHFFDADSHEFIGLRTQTDVGDPVCQGKGFWPRRVTCDNPTATQAVLGGQYSVGDPVVLP